MHLAPLFARQLGVIYDVVLRELLSEVAGDVTLLLEPRLDEAVECGSGGSGFS